MDARGVESSSSLGGEAVPSLSRGVASDGEGADSSEEGGGIEFSTDGGVESEGGEVVGASSVGAEDSGS